MKNLTLIVHADLRNTLADTLRSIKQLPGFTFLTVEGHNPQDEQDPAFSARDRVIGYTPHIRVDIMLQDEAVENVLHTLRNANCGLTGRCLYHLTAVEKQGAI